MGKDKYENEDLIKFHVDKLSSAHVYLRLHKGQTMDDIPKEVLIDCAHLVKATASKVQDEQRERRLHPLEQPEKTSDMDVGQIGFHRQKDVSEGADSGEKVNEILNRLEKTKVERFPDLAAEREARDREERNEKKGIKRGISNKIGDFLSDQALERDRIWDDDGIFPGRSYSSLMKAENMSSNQDGNDSDDFM
ncbi:coiled-coil domain-containing protein 25 [Chiroxiphia lanceolata]|uniref:coiled-coil domain-containing protein 25 n=1 Tax=Chiroxiphia lanceolata TaxID=296741 RepID=UPI0013CE57E4|nr:coiled-coil domain-containing protein 25 [Chiroxiphia lanceolata]